MSASPPRILVAGIGNIFLGDDAFGVEVIRVLARRPPIENVRLVDFGIRGMDLAYELLESYALAILVDAVPRGGTPGTIYTLVPAPPGDRSEDFDTHAMAPLQVLALASRLGRPVEQLLLVGCEPSPVDPDADPLISPSGLSEPVALAVEPAADRVLALIQEARSGSRVPNAERMTS
jgi:hydrogenase maturation protease